MKFHLFFLTITIQKETMSQNELKQEQQYKQIIDEIRDRRSKYYTHLYSFKYNKLKGVDYDVDSTV